MLYNNKKIFPQIFLFVFLGLFVLFSGWGGCSSATDYTQIEVIYVFDGDTIKLANGEKVRLIGIDTPEAYESDKLLRDVRRTGQDIETIKAMGRRAHEFTRNLLLRKKVRLEFDIEKRDKYGRLLAYVYDIETYQGMGDILSPMGYEIVNGNEIFINATIIKSGYATPMTIPPNTEHTDRFKKNYEEAREQKRGLWQQP